LPLFGKWAKIKNRCSIIFPLYDYPSPGIVFYGKTREQGTGDIFWRRHIVYRQFPG